MPSGRESALARGTRGTWLQQCCDLPANRSDQRKVRKNCPAEKKGRHATLSGSERIVQVFMFMFKRSLHFRTKGHSRRTKGHSRHQSYAGCCGSTPAR
ncbi:unnamed protein product [Laminaria digitata]